MFGTRICHLTNVIQPLNLWTLNPEPKDRHLTPSFSWPLILSHHEGHEDHKRKTHKITFILSCPSCSSLLWLPPLNSLRNHIILITGFCTRLRINFQQDSGNIVLRKAHNRKLGLVQSVQEAKKVASICDFILGKWMPTIKKSGEERTPSLPPKLQL